MNFDSFVSDLISTVIGGVILTFIFFLVKEKMFPKPDINGQWFLQIEILKTEYNPYKNMILRYIIIIWSDGNIIKGSAEKIYEDSTQEKQREYIGKERKRAKIEGFIEKKYFEKDKVYLHMIEMGDERESTTFYDLYIEKKNNNIEMIGEFNSTIANQYGRVKVQRNNF